MTPEATIVLGCGLTAIVLVCALFIASLRARSAWRKNIAERLWHAEHENKITRGLIDNARINIIALEHDNQDLREDSDTLTKYFGLQITRDDSARVIVIPPTTAAEAIRREAAQNITH